MVFMVDVRLDQRSAPDIRSVVNEFCRQRDWLNHGLKIEFAGRDDFLFLREGTESENNHEKAINTFFKVI